MENVKLFVKDIESTILIEDEYTFNIKLSIGNLPNGEFYLKMKFHSLKEEEINILVGLSESPQCLKIHSDHLLMPEYRISHVKVNAVRYVNDGSAQWDCTSNDPKFYKIIET